MRKIILGFIILILILLLGSWWADKNNPYSPNTWVKPFFTTSIDKNGQIKIIKTRDLYIWKTDLSKPIMYLQAFFRIEEDAKIGEKPFKGNEEQIIDQIHKERFDVNKPYTNSGGHFPEFYVRNFGIFYNAMLDSRIPTSKSDWLTRQRVTLQTTATHLELLKQENSIDYTTYIPVSNNTFVGADFNTYPSDSLFALVFTLNALVNPTFIADNLPTKNFIPSYPLQTEIAGKYLINNYKDVLTKAINLYLNYIIDEKTGLIKKNITLASARDSIKRQSSFYDNVIAWSTAKDAESLGLKINCPVLYVIPAKSGMTTESCNFNKWKENIISNFWDEKQGLFINDLSDDSIKNHTYTGEEFIVTPTGFLDFRNNNDKNKLIKMVSYVQISNLDKPFPLFYAKTNDVNNLYFWVRYFVPDYMGQSIWSHIGQEYIETLILLGESNRSYLNDAKKGLDSYSENIVKYGGYPELYDKNGNIFKNFFYKSLLHTGWVINFEQARMMLNP